MNKKNILIVILALLASGCSTAMLTPESKNPMPTQEFTAIGSYTHKAGADEIAMEKAQKFCNHWRAAVGVIEHTTSYQGKLLNEKAQEGVDMVKNSLPIIDGWGNKNAYETKIIYKCF